MNRRYKNGQKPLKTEEMKRANNRSNFSLKSFCELSQEDMELQGTLLHRLCILSVSIASVDLPVFRNFYGFIAIKLKGKVWLWNDSRVPYFQIFQVVLVGQLWQHVVLYFSVSDREFSRNSLTCSIPSNVDIRKNFQGFIEICESSFSKPSPYKALCPYRTRKQSRRNWVHNFHRGKHQRHVVAR